MRRTLATQFPGPWVSNPVDFSDAIRAARTQSGLTLAEAALSIGVAKQTLQDLEKGLGTVSIGLAMKIANEVGVSLFAVPSNQKHALLHIIESIDADDKPDIASDYPRGS